MPRLGSECFPILRASNGAFEPDLKKGAVASVIKPGNADRPSHLPAECVQVIRGRRGKVWLRVEGIAAHVFPRRSVVDVRTGPGDDIDDPSD